MASRNAKTAGWRLDPWTERLAAFAITFGGAGGLYVGMGLAQSLIDLSAYVDVWSVASGLVVSVAALLIASILFLAAGTLWLLKALRTRDLT